MLKSKYRTEPFAISKLPISAAISGNQTVLQRMEETQGNKETSDFHAYSSPLSRSHANPEVVQAFSLTWEDGKIKEIMLDRPPIQSMNPTILFPGWRMSPSHTTAFILIRRDLELRLQGKTFYEALYEIQQLTFNILSLPGFADMDEDGKNNVLTKINQLKQGTDQILNWNFLADITAMTETNRNILINGYAELYFLCRNSIYYSYHITGNGGGANNEAGNMERLKAATTYQEALQPAAALLDTKFTGSENYFFAIAQQHFLSVSSFFYSQGKMNLYSAFNTLAKNKAEILKIFEEAEDLILEDDQDFTTSSSSSTFSSPSSSTSV